MLVTSYNTAMGEVSVGRIVSFGEALRYYRTRAGIKQDQLAEMLDVRQSTLSRWENQAAPIRDPYMMSRIAVLLGVDVDDLIAGRIDRPISYGDTEDTGVRERVTDEIVALVPFEKLPELEEHIRVWVELTDENKRKLTQVGRVWAHVLGKGEE